MIVSVVSILLCLVVLCSMTYAWFTSETSSSSNTLMSGSFDITVNIAKIEGEAATANETVIFADGKYTLTQAGDYTVTLTPTGEATVKGYCIVTIDNNMVFGTGVILDENMVDETYKDPTAPFVFKIVTNKIDTVVSFESHWGVLVDPDIQEDTIIRVNGEFIEIENAGDTE